MSADRKIFPLRLPKGFHGQTLPYKKLSVKYSQRAKYQQNPQLGNIKVSNWQRKIRDSDVIQQRNQMVINVSKEAPQWCKTTYDYFRRNEALPKFKWSQKQQKKYDVFNRPRERLYELPNRSQSVGFQKNYMQQAPVSAKIGSENKTCSKFYSYKEVSAKIGSVQQRDFSCRRPQLKIGKQGFIDTYSIF